MLTPSLLFPIVIRLIRLDRGSIVLEAHGLIHRGRCPACGVTSARVHDRYQRHPLDLPRRACSVTDTIMWPLRPHYGVSGTGEGRELRVPTPTPAG